MLGSEDVIVHHKPRVLFRTPVRPTKVGQQIKALVVLEERAGVDDVLAGHNDGDLTVCIDHVGDPIRILCFQAFDVAVQLFSHKRYLRRSPHVSKGSSPRWGALTYVRASVTNSE